MQETQEVKDAGSASGSERSPGVQNDNPLQYSCLETSMDRGAQWATVHEVTKSWTRLSTAHPNNTGLIKHPIVLPNVQGRTPNNPSQTAPKIDEEGTLLE